jgi:hypothetical protein
MTSVLNSVTSWLGGSRERDRTPPGENERAARGEPNPDEKDSGAESSPTEGTDSSSVPTSTHEGEANESSSKTGLPVDINLQEVSEKAVNTAKEWGSM